jgi:hypothetical protein
MKSKHFAVNEYRIPEGCSRQFAKAQVAEAEFTVCKNTIGEIAFREVTVSELAILVLTSFKRLCNK